MIQSSQGNKSTVPLWTFSNMFAVANNDDAHLNKHDIVIPMPRSM